MRLESEQPDARDPSDEALDRLLRQACWEPTDPAPLQRRWSAMSSRRRRGRRLALVAAMLAIAIGAGVVLENMTSIDPAPPHGPKMLSVLPAASAVRFQVRDSTPYERLALLATPTRVSRAAAPTRRPPEPSISELAAQTRSRSTDQRLAAMEQLLARGTPSSIQAFLGCVRDSSRREDALAVLQRMPSPPIDGLIAALDDSLVANRLAAARALGTICDPRVTSRLQKMYDENHNRREALAAISACHDQTWVRSFVAEQQCPVVVRAQIQTIRNEMSELY